MSGHLGQPQIGAPPEAGAQRHPPAPPAESPTWRVISNSEEIDGSAADWGRLLPPDAAPFLTFGWNRAWYRHYADARDESILFVVSLGGLPVAIIPAYRRGREIRLAGDGICDYQDVIARNEESAQIALRLFILWGRRHRPDCDLVFEKLSTRGLLFQALSKLNPTEAAVYQFGRRYGPCPWIELPDSLDAYLALLPGKLRGDLRRGLNRLAREMPEAAVTTHRDRSIDCATLDACARFHVRHFRMQGESPLADPRLVALLREAAAVPEVGLRLSTLSADDKMLSVDFGFTRSGTYYGYLAGFDPAFGHLSPGKNLLLRRIDRWRRDDGVRVVDCLCGGEPYKMGLSRGQQYQVRTVRLLHGTLPNAFRFLGLIGRWLARGVCNRLLRAAGRDPLPL